MALGLDFLTRIVNVSWDLIDQQGLLAEYLPGSGAPDFESISEVMQGTPTAYALDSGRTFPGVNMGASGLGYTVFTRGLVCFGKPRDGDACFVVAPEFGYYEGSDALKKGILDESGELVWSAMGSGGSGKLVALTFAEDAFFATYYDVLTRTTTIATFDGHVWSSGSAFPASGDLGAQGGAVAATFRIIKDEDGKDKKIVTYVAAGQISQDNSEFANSASNLMWATSTDGSTWSSSSNMGMMAEPGTFYDIISNYACTIAAGAISANKQIFAAAAATKTLVPDPNPTELDPPPLPFAMRTAGAAVSETGSDWATITLPGALEAGLDQLSWGLAVTFVTTKEDNGYFLMSDHEYITGDPGHAIPKSNLYKSSDGRTWSKMRSNINWMSTLSAIDKDLGATMIVHI